MRAARDVPDVPGVTSRHTSGTGMAKACPVRPGYTTGSKRWNLPDGISIAPRRYLMLHSHSSRCGSRARLTLQALTEAETLAFEDQDVTAMHQPIQEGRRHALVAEDLGPLGDLQVRGQPDAGALIAVGTMSRIMRGSLLLASNLMEPA